MYFQSCMRSCLAIAQIKKCGCADARFPVEERHICDKIKKPDTGQSWIFFVIDRFFSFFHVSFPSSSSFPWSIIYYTNFELYRDDSRYLLYVILRCRAIPRSISALSDFLLLFYDEKYVSIVRRLNLNLLHFYVSEICLDDLTTQFNEEGLDCDTDCPVPCRWKYTEFISSILK